MNIRLSAVLALVMVAAFPAFSLYSAISGAGITAEDKAVSIALSFIRGGPTYTFDGISETLRVESMNVLKSVPFQYVISISFDSRHSGYGDRTGKVLLEVITHHMAVVRVARNKVVSAVLDGKWDEFNQRETAINDSPTGVIQPPEFARDTAIKYLRSAHDEARNISIASSWKTLDLTPQGLVGASKLQFSSEQWRVIITWPVIRAPIYSVEITYSGKPSLAWSGTVDQTGATNEIYFRLTP